LIVLACVVGSMAGYATVTQGEPRARGTGSLEGLDYAFRFATAIYNDDKDKAKAQAAVVRDYIELGALDEAADRTAMIEGWRRALALADLGRALGAAGSTDEARRAIAEAQRLRNEVTNHHGPRIDHHIAQALTAVGDVERSNEISQDVAKADRLQYLGRSIALRATSYARKGEFDAAMDYLGLVDINQKGIDDLAWWRTKGYLEIGGMEDLTREQRLAALSAARTSLEAVGGASYADGLLALAAGYKALGVPEGAAKALDAAEGLVDRIPDHHPNKPNEMASLARIWAGIGETERALRLLNKAESIIPMSQPIEQPAFFAWVAGSYMVLGDAEEASRLFDRALTVAETLVNPRPRALAFVAIGRSMGQHGVEVPDRFRPRLEAALAGLKPPSPGGAS
jgi:tetratricopeptide (TPR) repeat protein